MTLNASYATRTIGILTVLVTLGLFPCEALAGRYTLGPTTLRSCSQRKSYADPVNVLFVGLRGTWQNSQRLVGKRGSGSALMWRTTTRAAGGSQDIVDTSAASGCITMQAQSSTRGGNVSRNKHHTRFFEQSAPSLVDGSNVYRVTGQDAHRDITTRNCNGPGALVGTFNDRVPQKQDGYPGGGYDQAQREFLAAFRGRLGRTSYARGPARNMKFVQCAYEEQPRRYAVGWNGIITNFYVDDSVPCQEDWHSLANRLLLGSCPTGG